MTSRSKQLQRLREDVVAGRLTRRSVLRRAAAMGLSGPLIATLLASCSGPNRSDAPDAATAGVETPVSPSRIPAVESPPETIDRANVPVVPTMAPVTPTVEVNPEPTSGPSPTPDTTYELERSDTLTAGFVYTERYLDHNPGAWMLPGTSQTFPFSEPVLHPSNYRLAQRTKQLLDLTGLSQSLVSIEPRAAAPEDLTAFHTEAYVEKVRQICANGGGETGAGAPASAASYEVALLAVGGGMAAVDAVAGGSARRVFVNVRPPGHHAKSDMGMGFCIFNNIVVAAHYAQRAHGYARVMILDWDVHHGNGTQDAFYDDPSVLFISMHQDQLFPSGLGEVDQVGSGDGAGYTVNLPLPPGSGDATYLAAFEQIIVPIAGQFQPDLVLISAGQDASAMDQLGRMAVTSEGYRQMTQRMVDLAETHAGGRLVAMQEGGYSEVYAPYCTLNIIETLAGVRSGLPEPLTHDRMLTQPQTTTVGADAQAALQAIRDQQSQFWSL